MRGATAAPADELRAAWERAERVRQDTAEAEGRAFQAWQDAYGAHDVARDEERAARRAYLCQASAGVPA